MSDIDRDLYGLFAQCYLVGLPLSNGLFADGLAGKHELMAMLRRQLREWLDASGQHSNGE